MDKNDNQKGPDKGFKIVDRKANGEESQVNRPSKELVDRATKKPEEEEYNACPVCRELLLMSDFLHHKRVEGLIVCTNCGAASMPLGLVKEIHANTSGQKG